MQFALAVATGQLAAAVDTATRDDHDDGDRDSHGTDRVVGIVDVLKGRHSGRWPAEASESVGAANGRAASDGEAYAVAFVAAFVCRSVVAVAASHAMGTWFQHSPNAPAVLVGVVLAAAAAVTAFYV